MKPANDNPDVITALEIALKAVEDYTEAAEEAMRNGFPECEVVELTGAHYEWT